MISSEHLLMFLFLPLFVGCVLKSVAGESYDRGKSGHMCKSATGTGGFKCPSGGDKHQEVPTFKDAPDALSTILSGNKLPLRNDRLHKRSVEEIDDENNDPDDDEEEEGPMGTDGALTTTTLMRGGKSLISCFSADLSSARLLDPKVIWYRGNNEPLVDGRITETAEGNVEIVDAEAQDSGTYSCAVEARDENGEDVKKTFKHVVIVYILPDLHYDVVLKYTSASCDNVLKDRKVSEIKSALCTVEECVVKDVSGRCHSVSGGSDSSSSIKHELWITFLVGLPENDELPRQCDVTCMEKEILSRLNTELSEVKKFVKNESANNRPDADLVKIDEAGMSATLKSACGGGYRPEKVFCIPCLPGSFSKKQQKVCVECPRGQYQPNFAAKGCVSCASGTNTTTLGARLQEECKKPNVVSITVDKAKASSTAGVAVGVVIAIVIIVAVVAALYKMQQAKTKKLEKEKETQKLEGEALTAAASYPDRLSDRRASGSLLSRTLQQERHKECVTPVQSDTDSDTYMEPMLQPAGDDQPSERRDSTVRSHSPNMAYLQGSPKEGPNIRSATGLPLRRNTLYEPSKTYYQPYLSEALHVMDKEEEPSYHSIRSPSIRRPSAPLVKSPLLSSPPLYMAPSPPRMPFPPTPPRIPPPPPRDSPGSSHNLIETRSWYGTD